MRRPQALEEKRSHATLCRIGRLSKRDQRGIVDKAGKVIREVKVETKPAAILSVLTEETLTIERIGLESRRPRHDPGSALTIAGGGLQPQ
jgi:hypothetical protein